MEKVISIVILVCFIFTGPIGVCPVYADAPPQLPAPGVMVHLSSPMNPPILKGIKVNPNNPFRFEFIMDVGDGSPVPNKGEETSPLREESTKLIKYFLASLTIPEK